MLQIDNLNSYYADLQALWDVSLKVEDKEIVAIVGSNCAGKSTILKSVTGLIKPKTGTVNYDGIPLNKVPTHKIVEMGLCMVPEARRLFPDMSVIDNMEMGAFPKKARKSREENLQWIYDMFPVLKDRVKQMAKTLSGGEQQMLAIGRAMMSQPKLLLLDEISLGLSPLLVENIFKTVKQINESKGISILIVEQNVHLALEMADRGYIIENGRIVGEGTAKELLESKKVKDAYLSIGTTQGEAE